MYLFNFHGEIDSDIFTKEFETISIKYLDHSHTVYEMAKKMNADIITNDKKLSMKLLFEMYRKMKCEILQ